MEYPDDDILGGPVEDPPEDYDCYDPHEDDYWDIFCELFGDALSDVANLYSIHRKAKGDSWQEMDIRDLRSRLSTEFAEWVGCKDAGLCEYNELLDVVNMALMLAQRLRGKGE